MSKMFFKSLLLVLSVGLSTQSNAKVSLPSVSDNWKVSTKAEKAQCVFAGVETFADLFVTAQKGSGSTKAQYARCAVRDAARVTGHAVKAYNSWYEQDRDANKIQEGLLFGYDAMQLFTNGLHALSTEDHTFEKKLVDQQCASPSQLQDYVLSCVAGAVAMCEALAIHPETDAQTRAALQNAYVLARALREASDYRTDMRYLLGVGVLLVANVASWYQTVTGDYDYSVVDELNKMLDQQNVDAKKLDYLLAQAERFKISLDKDLSAKGQSKKLLEHAFDLGQDAVVKKCIDVNDDLLFTEFKREKNILLYAAKNGNAPLVDYLINLWDVQNDETRYGENHLAHACHIAVDNRQASVVEKIVDLAYKTIPAEKRENYKDRVAQLLGIAKKNDDVATGAALLKYETSEMGWQHIPYLLGVQGQKDHFRMCCLTLRDGSQDADKSLLYFLCANYDKHKDGIEMLVRHNLVTQEMLCEKSGQQTVTCARYMLNRHMEKYLAAIAKNADQQTKDFLRGEFGAWYITINDYASLSLEYKELAQTVGYNFSTPLPKIKS
ncbi:MAG: hypothetical protein H6679_00405 [Epsilonproteobacteria bacterium]|nr:hypothetical protein [Campylobacterota bacterium]